MGGDRRLELAWLRRALLEEVTLGDRVDALLAHTTSLLGDVRVGVALVRRGAWIVAGVTDPLLARLDEVQQLCGSGPDVALVTDRHVVLVGDVDTCDRWVPWALQAGRGGLRSMIGVRLRTPTCALGSLTAYAPAPGRFALGDLATLRAIAGHAGPALATAGERDRLWDAVDSRRVIGLAQGILMEAYGVDGQEAADVLSRRSRARRLPQNALAGQLVADVASRD